MLACARIGAPHNVVFGGFSAEAVRERMEFSEAKVLITVDGAARKGKTAPVKDRVDEVMGDLADAREDRRRAQQGHAVCRCRRGATSSTTRSCAAADAGVPGRAAGRRAPALHPLHLRLDGQAEGHPAHHRRLPDGRLGDPPLRVRPEARDGRLLVRGRRRLGHRPLLHRLRAAGQRRDLGDVGGRAGLPQQGHLVGDRRALRRQHPLLRADRDPRVHQVGGAVARASTTSRRCGCSARSASRSTRRRGSGTTR